jgi:hypothetical protein
VPSKQNHLCEGGWPRKACAACVKAKQRCDGGVGQVE